jgi:hypothetical protein
MGWDEIWDGMGLTRPSWVRGGLALAMGWAAFERIVSPEAELLSYE